MSVHDLHVFPFLLSALYAVAFALYFRHFSGPDTQLDFWGSRILRSAVGVHIVYLIMRGVTLEHFPFATSAEFLSMVALSVATVYVLVETRHKDPNTGVFFLGLILLLELASSVLMSDVTSIPIQARQSIFGLHVVFTVFGFAGLSMSAIYALMYVLLSRQLKSRSLGVIFQRLPPLATLENMSKLATIAGVLLLGLGLALGHWVAASQGAGLAISEPIIIAADLIWVAYFIGLVVASVRGLSGLRMGYLSLVGYILLVGTVFVILSVSGALHSFS